MPGLEDNYLRVFYRSTLKQQLYFLAALGIEIPKTWGALDENLVELAFGEKPEMKEILIDLKRRNFWDEDANHTKERIFMHLLKSASQFFQEYPFHPEVCSSLPTTHDGSKVHIESYELL
jgi:enoyl-[acyl-carrier-protein] reductase (NADH)